MVLAHIDSKACFEAKNTEGKRVGSTHGIPVYGDAVWDISTPVSQTTLKGNDQA